MTATVRIEPEHESEKEAHPVFSESRAGRPREQEDARPVSIQIWALRSRLEKQPTGLQRRHYYMRGGALAARDISDHHVHSMLYKFLISLADIPITLG